MAFADQFKPISKEEFEKREVQVTEVRKYEPSNARNADLYKLMSNMAIRYKDRMRILATIHKYHKEKGSIFELTLDATRIQRKELDSIGKWYVFIIENPELFGDIVGRMKIDVFRYKDRFYVLDSDVDKWWNLVAEPGDMPPTTERYM